MFTCVDNERRKFFHSNIKAPTERCQPIVEFLSQEPWRQILKKELAYDSDDENCTVIKTLKQDKREDEDRDDHEGGSVSSRLECWHKLKELTYYLPELKCILNDVNYAGSDETRDDVTESKDGNEEEHVSKNVIKPDCGLQDVLVCDKSASKSVYVESLFNVLYRNESFAKLLDGIVHKEILELIQFDGDFECEGPKLSLDKRKSGYKSVESYLFKREAGFPDEDSHVSQESPCPYVEAQEQLDYLLEESSTMFEVQPEELEKSTEDVGSEEPLESLQEKSDLSSLSSRNVSSDDISDADELMNDLLGAINYQDVIEEWKNAKRDKKLKAQQVVEILEPKKSQDM